MKIIITIEAKDNDAFQGDPGAEIGRVLEKLISRLGGIDLVNGAIVPLFDSNGNRVGLFLVQD